MSNYNPPDLSADELMTMQEVAKALRVDPTTVRRWIHHGLLKVVELPHRGNRHLYRIRKATVNTIIAGSPLE